MEQRGKQYVELTNGEVVAEYASKVCRACSKPKTEGSAFCTTCVLALPAYLRNWVNDPKQSSEYYVENYRRALQTLLDLGPHRRVQYLGGGIRWRYSNTDQMEAAGYKFCNHDVCRVPGCRTRITWYFTPNDRKMAINLADSMPHAPSCNDPEYFQRRKEEKRVQSSARREAKRRVAR